MKKYRLLSWNVNGIRAIQKKGFIDWFKKENPDIKVDEETLRGIAAIFERSQP